MTGDRFPRRRFRRMRATQSIRPHLETLEDRFLLYASTGTQWSRPKRITYSFVPDGTSIGGTPSNLQATLNSQFAASDWQAQFAKAAAAWQKMANVNFALVSDNGDPLGTAGNQQNDSRFGDIRIGGYAMSGSILAFAYLAPPANGGTNAGDMFFNTAQAWQINGTTYDLMTVAIHEFGHALGLGHSTDSTASMYSSYTTTKQAVNTDDINGIRSVYNSRQNDFFDANGTNDKSLAADNISSYIDSNGQLTLSALDSTTPVMIGAGDIDWYKIVVPTTTTGTMVVRMQSAKLSLLAPNLAVFNSTGTVILAQQSSSTMGDTVSVTLTGVTAGQVYLIRGKGSTTGDSGFGAYGLQVNFGSLTQPPVTAPDTTMTETADSGGGTMSESTDDSGGASDLAQDNAAIPGVPTFWVWTDGDSVVSEDNGVVGTVDSESDGTDGSSDDGTAFDPTADSSGSIDGVTIQVGSMSGTGDAFLAMGFADPVSDPGLRTLAPWTPLTGPPAWSATAFASQRGASATSITLATPDFALDFRTGFQDFFSLQKPSNRRPERLSARLVDLALDVLDDRTTT